jgi:hypothetical protein
LVSANNSNDAQSRNQKQKKQKKNVKSIVESTVRDAPVKEHPRLSPVNGDEEILSDPFDASETSDHNENDDGPVDGHLWDSASEAGDDGLDDTLFKYKSGRKQENDHDDDESDDASFRDLGEDLDDLPDDDEFDEQDDDEPVIPPSDQAVEPEESAAESLKDPSISDINQRIQNTVRILGNFKELREADK